MSSITLIRYLIDCDGCQAIFGDHEGFDSLTEARAAAYGQGWRFPNQLKANGQAATHTSDVCGECAPDWKPHASGEKRNFQRMLSRAEVDQLRQRDPATARGATP